MVGDIQPEARNPERGDRLESHTLNTRLCAYPHCWRGVEADDAHRMCPEHERRLTDDLSWLEANLPDLTGYRLNRAYGGNHDGPHGARAEAPEPLRGTLYDLIWCDSDDGTPSLQSSLYGLARSLGCPVTWDTPLDNLAETVRESPRLMSCPATPTYAMELHRQTGRLRSYTARSDDLVVYGQCPADGCTGRLAAPSYADHVECKVCHSEWQVSYLRKLRCDRILESDRKGTRKQLVSWLNLMGVRVKPATLRSWTHRGRLPQEGEDDRSQPVYSLKTAFQLATGIRSTIRKGDTNE